MVQCTNFACFLRANVYVFILWCEISLTFGLSNKYTGDVTVSEYLPPSLVTLCHQIGIPPSLPPPVTSFLNGP